MKKQRAPIEVFSLSFLDIISCAFGAVVMLILLAKNGEEGQFNDTSQISNIIQALTRAEASVGQLDSALSDKLDQLKQLQAQSASHAEEEDALEAELARAKQEEIQLTNKASGLEDVQEERKRAAITTGNAKKRDEEVGGIPVDSDYVIFIVDTSGSMKADWRRVMRNMSNVLDTHPKVKGFQVLSDNGEFLIRSSKGSWRKDTPRQRQAILRSMAKWHGSSNSSPVEGIETALKTYANKTKSLAIYVFGDEYTGGSYDRTLETINKLNTHPRTKKKIARIHSVAFYFRDRIETTEKFATLMREVSRQNNGTFLALSD